MNSEIRQALAQEFPDDPQDSKKDEVPNEVPIELADKYFRKVWEWYRKDDKNPDYKWDKGDGYFDPTSISLMELLTQVRKGGSSVSGFTKIIPFRNYHEPKAGRFISEILAYLDQGKTVTVDLSIAPEELVRFFSEMLSRAVFGQQMKKFTSSELHDQYVQFYFEEAHNLFPRDDKDLSGIYNRLAKEGAKFNIGIVYSTQSIQSLSPDLLKNTENFFIAHLNDQSEINALTRFHEFRDVGPDVQRTKTRGFVRMITRSHKFALPVQINKFEPAER